MTSDSVDHPDYYNTGEMEVIDAIEGLGLGFHEGNILKYIARHGHKGAQIQDLNKAKWYIERLIGRANGGNA